MIAAVHYTVSDAQAEAQIRLAHLLDGPDDGSDASSATAADLAYSRSFGQPSGQSFDYSDLLAGLSLNDGGNDDVAPVSRVLRFNFDLRASANRLVAGLLNGIVIAVSAVAVVSLVFLGYLSLSTGPASAAAFAKGVTADVANAPLVLQIKDLAQDATRFVTNSPAPADTITGGS